MRFLEHVCHVQCETGDSGARELAAERKELKVCERKIGVGVTLLTFNQSRANGRYALRAKQAEDAQKIEKGEEQLSDSCTLDTMR